MGMTEVFGWWPLNRQARLRAIAEDLRSENWPIVNSLQERSEADPNNESVLDLLPVVYPHEMTTMVSTGNPAPEATTTVVGDGADH